MGSVGKFVNSSLKFLILNSGKNLIFNGQFQQELMLLAWMSVHPTQKLMGIFKEYKKAHGSKRQYT